MKTIFALCAVVLLAGTALVVYRLNRPQHFGAPFAGAPAVAIAEVVKRPEDHLTHDIRVEGTIGRQCPSTGCWFFLAGENGTTLRVELSGLGITLPQKKDHVAVVEGRLSKNGDTFELLGNGVEFR